MTLMKIAEELYEKYLHSDFNDFNCEYIFNGIKNAIEHFTTMLPNFDNSDFINYYLEVYNIKYHKKDLVNNIEIIVIPQENTELVFISDNADFNELKNYISNNMKVILVYLNIDTIISTFKKDIFLRLLREYDTLSYNQKAYKEIADILA